MIFVVATIQITAGQRAAFLEQQRQLLPLVRAEAGCLQYAPSIEIAADDRSKSPPRENVVVMHEEWESLEALQAHACAPHMLEFREKVRHLVVGVKIEVFQSV